MLKTLIGPRKSELMAHARALLGEKVEMVETRPIMLDDGGEHYAIIAATNGDPLPPDEEILSRWGIRPEHCRLVPERRDLVRPARPGDGPMTIAFVGPTGAGKTTTMAKLAMHPRIFGRPDLRVGVACLDTYRAGASEQLKLYADLANATFEMIYTPEDAIKFREATADLDILLIDAPGRAWRQEADLKQVRDILRTLRPHETHLAMPAGLLGSLVREWVSKYSRLGITHLMPTKLDDCPDDWKLFDLAAHRRLPIRWMGEGQDIPADVRSGQARLARAALAHATRIHGTEF